MLKIAVYCSCIGDPDPYTIKQVKEQLLNKYDCDLYLYTSQPVSGLGIPLFQVEEAGVLGIKLSAKQHWYQLFILNNLRRTYESKERVLYNRIIQISLDHDLSDIKWDVLQEHLLTISAQLVATPTDPDKMYEHDRDLIDIRIAFGHTGVMGEYCNAFSYYRDYIAEGLHSAEQQGARHLQEKAISHTELL